MNQNILQLFRSYFELNKNSEGLSPEYGIELETIDWSNNTINIRLIFKRGKTYCCGEPNCHFGSNWTKLRSIAKENNIELHILW